MGQKVNPHVIRLNKVHTWSSRWFNEKQYKETLIQDFKLRKMLMEKLKGAGVAGVEIERSINSLRIVIHVSRPGIVIGRGGSGLEELKKSIAKLFVGAESKLNPKLDIRVEPVKEPNLDAHLVAVSVADQLIRRLPFKRVLGATAERVMNAGALGVKIMLSGRIAGSEIARVEKVHVGTVPLSTIRANIQYESLPALTKKGYIGVKVWINKSEEK